MGGAGGTGVGLRMRMIEGHSEDSGKQLCTEGPLFSRCKPMVSHGGLCMACGDVQLCVADFVPPRGTLSVSPPNFTTWKMKPQDRVELM